MSYLLVLVGCDCSEFSLWEGEAVHPLGRQRVDLRQVHPWVMLDDVHSRLVFMHWLKDYLQRARDKVLNIPTKSALLNHQKLQTINLEIDLKQTYESFCQETVKRAT